VSSASKFPFDRDFREATRVKRITEEDLAQAAEVARAQGFAEGQAAGARQMAQMVALMGERAQALIVARDGQIAQDRAAAIEFAVAFARKLAGSAVARAPLAPIAEAAAAAFDHLQHVPHLVVRVHESFVDEVERVLARMAEERGFTGRLIVLGEPDMMAGDARLEWADGGLVRDMAALDEAITKAVTDWAADPATKR
jgi:flagellar assembly protein FliH